MKFLRTPLNNVAVDAVQNMDKAMNKEFKAGYAACYEQICHELRLANPSTIIFMQPIMGAVQRKLKAL